MVFLHFGRLGADMGKWIAALLILVFLVLPVPLVLVSPDQSLAGLVFSWLAPKDEVALGREYIDDVRMRNFQPVVKALEPQFATPKTSAQLVELANGFPNEKPLSVKLVGSQTLHSSSLTTYNLTYEYQFSRSWMLGVIALHRSGDKLSIYGLHLKPQTASLEQVNALTFAGKSRTHYLFAGAAVLVFVFWAVSVFACLFTPMARRKWLWVIFVLLGFLGLNLNWTTGQLSFLLINVSVPAVRAWHNFYGPWIIQIAFPVGAIVFWLRRGTLMEEAEASSTPDMRP